MSLEIEFGTLFLQISAHAYPEAFEPNGHVEFNIPGIQPPKVADQWIPLLRLAWDNDVVTVVACKNNESPFGNYDPMRFGNANNPLITVCRLTPTGGRPEGVAVKGPATFGPDKGNLRLIGNDDIYAIGEALDIPASNSQTVFGPGDSKPPPDGWETDSSGSSYSAPQIAALSSYIAGSTTQFKPLSAGSVSMERKKQLLNLMRSDSNYDTLGAAYNGVREICTDPPTAPPRNIR